jgi:hypothetical protein
MVKAHFPDLDVQDKLKIVAGGPPQDQWLGAVSFGLKQLSHLKRGSVRLLDVIIFYGLIVVIAFAAIPYGTVEPWSHAVFEAAIFFLALLWVIHGFLSGSWGQGHLDLFYPLIALVALAVLQSLSWSSIDVALDAAAVSARLSSIV